MIKTSYIIKSKQLKDEEIKLKAHLEPQSIKLIFAEISHYIKRINFLNHLSDLETKE